jgi:hypothetical protein
LDIQPRYYKVYTGDRTLLVKHEVVGEFDHNSVRKFEDAARKYRKKRQSYQIGARTSDCDDSVQRIVAGLILHFSDFEEFFPAQVLIWAAFADEYLILKQVQGALSGKALKPIVRRLGNGYWIASEGKLRRYLGAL